MHRPLFLRIVNVVDRHPQNLLTASWIQPNDATMNFDYVPQALLSSCHNLYTLLQNVSLV
jgi:hypothetical protein